MPSANRFGARHSSRTMASSASIKTQPSPRHSVRRSLPRLPTSWKTFAHRSSASILDFRRPLYSRVFGVGARNFSPLPPQLKKRSGWRRVASTQSSHKGSKPVAIAAIFLSDDLTRQLTTFTHPVYRAGGERSRRRCGWNRRYSRRSRSAFVRRGRRAARHCVSALPEGSYQFGAPRGVNKRCRSSHRPNEFVQRPFCARHPESLDARPWHR
jgi:hypothetical protein